jgi:hypothetical protein
VSHRRAGLLRRRAELRPGVAMVPAIRPLASWLVVLRADNGRGLLQRNLIQFDSGTAFDPNPPKSSGGPFRRRRTAVAGAEVA